MLQTLVKVGNSQMPEVTFPKIRIPESLSEDMKFVLDNRISFTEEDKNNTLIKAIADESFH